MSICELCEREMLDDGGVVHPQRTDLSVPRALCGGLRAASLPRYRQSPSRRTLQLARGGRPEPGRRPGRTRHPRACLCRACRARRARHRLPALPRRSRPITDPTTPTHGRRRTHRRGCGVGGVHGERLPRLAPGMADRHGVEGLRGHAQRTRRRHHAATDGDAQPHRGIPASRRAGPGPRRVLHPSHAPAVRRSRGGSPPARGPSGELTWAMVLARASRTRESERTEWGPRTGGPTAVHS